MENKQKGPSGSCGSSKGADQKTLNQLKNTDSWEQSKNYPLLKILEKYLVWIQKATVKILTFRFLVLKPLSSFSLISNISGRGSSLICQKTDKYFFEIVLEF